MHAELEKQAHTDPLTGALNRRAMLEQLSTDVSTACRKGQWISVLAFELDHFKAINDRHGHDVGDAVLRHFTHIVTAQKRASDSFARLGGEEFVLILPDTRVRAARDVGARIQLALAAAHNPALPEYTTSGGISGQLFKPSTTEEKTGAMAQLLKQADTALYHAKQSGRNRIETHTDA